VALSTDNPLAKPEAHATTHTDIDLDHDRDIGHDLEPDYDLDPDFGLDLGNYLELDLGKLIFQMKDL